MLAVKAIYSFTIFTCIYPFSKLIVLVKMLSLFQRCERNSNFT